MRVYYISFILVWILTRFAEKTDYYADGFLDLRESHHSFSTRNAFLLAGCILICVAGFRYYVGADYGAYYWGYTSYISNLSNSWRNLDEPGYGTLAWLASKIYNDGAAAIFMASLVTVGLPLIVIYRNTDRLCLSTILYMSMCWIGSFNGVRQYLAASVMLCGYRFLKERKLLHYLLVVFLAFLFHRSAIVFVLLYVIVHRDISVPNIFIVILAAGLVLVSYDRVFSVAGLIMEKNYSINNEYTATVVNRIRVISACIPAIIFLYFYKDHELDDKETFHLNLSIFHAAICFFTMNSALLYRIGIYTSYLQVVTIPELLNGLSENNRKLITAGILFMYIGMCWYEVYNSSSLKHFQWIWERSLIP